MLKSLLKAIIPKDILEFFYLWTPYSANWFLYPSLTAKNANLYPQVVFQLQKYISSKNSLEKEILNSKDFGQLNPEFDATLSSLFRKHGSDKSTSHDYSSIYAYFLNKLGLDQPLKILEIGLGTNNPNLVSSMGKTGTPGASLRTFRDALPKAEIYGADIDEDILFTEQRIKTAWVDQFDQSSFITMTDTLGETEFDLIIDDGLHAVSANLNSLLFALSHLRESGVFIAEDIREKSVNVWLPIIEMLREHYNCGIIKCQSTYLFFCERKIPQDCKCDTNH